MTLREGNLGLSFRRVGIWGRDVTTQGNEAWLMMYSVAEGPSVSYRETVYSDCDIHARSRGYVSRVHLKGYQPHLTCYLPFRSVLAPETDSMLLLHYSSLLTDLNDTSSKVGPSLLNITISQPLIFPKRLGRRIIGSVSQASVCRMALRCEGTSARASGRKNQ